MDERIKHNLDWLESFKTSSIKLRRDFNRIEALLNSNNQRFRSLASFLQGELRVHSDDEAQKRLSAIMQEFDHPPDDSTSPATQATTDTDEESFNKSQFLRDLWATAGAVTPKELYELAQKTEKGRKISLAYVNNTIFRSRDNGKARKAEGDDKRYIFTNGNQPLLQGNEVEE